MLSGKKTYIVAAAMVVLSGLLAQGYITQGQYQIVMTVLAGLGIAAVRHGIANSK